MAIAIIPTATPLNPNHWMGLRRSPRNATAMRIVTAGPNDEARPTSQVGAFASPIAERGEPDDVERPGERRSRPGRADGAQGQVPGEGPSSGPLARRRARNEDDADDEEDAERRVHDPRDEQDLEPVRVLDRDVGRDRHHREQDQGDDREDDAGACEPGAPPAAIEGDAGQDDAHRGDPSPEGLERGEGLAAQDDGEHDGQPAVRRDHAAHDGDRADAQPGEVGEVRAGTDQAEERRVGERGRIGRDGRARQDGDTIRMVAPTTWTPAVTRRLPMTRLARADAMSIVPQARAAPRPVRSPMGIGGD